MRLRRIIVATSMLYAGFTFPAYASVDFTQTKLFQGTSNLLWAGTAALTAITVAVTIFLSIKAGMAWQIADDQEKPQKKKVLIHTVAIGVIVACLSGIITLVLGAYGLSDGSGGQTAQGIYNAMIS